MFKKLFTVLSLILIFSPTNISHAAQITKEVSCADIKEAALEMCNDCRFFGRDDSVEVEFYIPSGISETDENKFTSVFSKSEFECKNIIPLLESDSQSLFKSNNVTCLNIEQTQCQSNGSSSTRLYPELVPSDSEFFNVNEVLVAPGQGGAFIRAVEENGPILGPILLIINFLTGIIATLAILALVIGGFFMVTARGEESQITRGKDIVKNSLIAIVVVLGSYTLIRTIQATVLLILN